MWSSICQGLILSHICQGLNLSVRGSIYLLGAQSIYQWLNLSVRGSIYLLRAQSICQWLKLSVRGSIYLLGAQSICYGLNLFVSGSSYLSGAQSICQWLNLSVRGSVYLSVAQSICQVPNLSVRGSSLSVRCPIYLLGAQSIHQWLSLLVSDSIYLLGAQSICQQLSHPWIKICCQQVLVTTPFHALKKKKTIKALAENDLSNFPPNPHMQGKKATITRTTKNNCCNSPRHNQLLAQRYQPIVYGQDIPFTTVPAQQDTNSFIVQSYHPILHRPEIPSTTVPTHQDKNSFIVQHYHAIVYGLKIPFTTVPTHHDTKSCMVLESSSLLRSRKAMNRCARSCGIGPKERMGLTGSLILLTTRIKQLSWRGLTCARGGEGSRVAAEGSGGCANLCWAASAVNAESQIRKHNKSDLFDLFPLYAPSRSLHSSADTCLLKLPLYKCKTKGDRAFSNSGPSVSNSLPLHIRNATTIITFKSTLKTHLFNLQDFD